MRRNWEKISIGIFLIFLIGFLATDKGFADNGEIIRITTDGFAPRQITIDEGSIVKFLNKDVVDHWPASDFHPTHSIYPEFDPRRPIKANESWEFRMNKIGIWKYHDHLFPHRKGVIEVSGEGKDDRLGIFDNLKLIIEQLKSSILNFFSRTNIAAEIYTDSKILTVSDFKNLKEKQQYRYLDSIIKKQGFNKGWEYVFNHDLAHFFGAKIYEEKGLEGLSICNSSFAFGCYHGFSQAAFLTGLDKLPEIAKGCERVGPINSGPWASCTHGIGHGVATFFETIRLNESLATCDKLTDGADYCHDGVFMEFAVSAPQSIYEVEKKDYLYPCNEIDSKYRQGCARQQPHVMMKFYGLTFKEIVNVCLNSRDKTIRYHCPDSVGLLIGQKSAGDPQIVIDECNLLTNIDVRAQCVSAAAGEIVFQKYQGWEKNSFATCENLFGSFKQSCKNRVQQTIKSYN